MRMRFVLPVAALSLSMSGCGGSASSAAAHSSAVRGSNLAAVAQGNSSPSTSASASKPAPTSVKAASAPLVDARGNPIIPAAAKAHTDAGAIAFTKYYWALLADFDARPRDPQALRVLAATDCDVTCLKEQNAIKKLAQEGTKFEGTRQTLSELQTAPVGKGDKTVVFLLEERGGKRVSREKSTNLGDYRLEVNAFVRWQGDGWKVVGVSSSPR